MTLPWTDQVKAQNIFHVHGIYLIKMFARSHLLESTPFPPTPAEHLGRFRGKLASDVCRRIPFVELQNGTTYTVLDHRFRFITYTLWYMYRKNSLFVCHLQFR